MLSTYVRESDFAAFPINPIRTPLRSTRNHDGPIITRPDIPCLGPVRFVSEIVLVSEARFRGVGSKISTSDLLFSETLTKHIQLPFF